MDGRGRKISGTSPNRIANSQNSRKQTMATGPYQMVLSRTRTSSGGADAATPTGPSGNRFASVIGPPLVQHRFADFVAQQSVDLGEHLAESRLLLDLDAARP